MALVASEEVKPVVLGKSRFEALARSTSNVLLDVLTDKMLDVLSKVTTTDDKTLVSIERASGTKLSKHKGAEVVCCPVQLLADLSEIEPDSLLTLTADSGRLDVDKL